jgi:hypothetical protein
VSRSNPSEHLSNPSTRWFEWNGEKGEIRYYDKDAKKDVDVPLPFSFMLLDELATVRGWHDASSSGIYSNEVRDTTQDVFVVKSFKGGILAEGKYREIKKDVNAEGGAYNANCYIAYKNGDGLKIGSLRLKGAALRAWMDFRKAHKADIYKKAIKIENYTEGQKGRVIFRVPEMKLTSIGPEADTQAKQLDKELQEFLNAYLRRNRREQAEATATHHVSDEEMASQMGGPKSITDDDIPF